MKFDDKAILNVAELSEFMGISKTLAYRLTHTEDFPKIRYGRRLLIPVKELNIWISKQSKIDS